MDRETIRRAPKVVLHDHLDGGLRPETVLALAQQSGHRLPADHPDDLRRWFAGAAHSGSLEHYLQTFQHTVAVLQTAENLSRAATEMVEDMVADGVCYVETRWCPQLHTTAGLTAEAAVEAVRDGLAAGVTAARQAGHFIVARQLITAMRDADWSRRDAELAVAYHDQGVAGFDIAGAEAGYPPTLHQSACNYMKRNNGYITIHAGEAFGLPSIWEALQLCGANRLGHGTRITDDIHTAGDRPAQLGDLASYIRNLRVPLEMCPSSNVATGAVASIKHHPIDLLSQLRFRVTVNTDNRLMGDTSMTREFELLADAFGYDLAEMEWLTMNAAKSAFYPFADRLAMINDVITPGYAALSI
jgi:adenosine deaminase